MQIIFWKRVLGLVLLGLTILWSPALMAQIAVSAQLDSAEIMIGDQVGLTLFINHTPGVEIDRIDWAPLDEIKEIEVLDYGSLNTVAESGEILLEQKLTLTSFDSGYYFIPQIPVYFKDNGKTGIEKSAQLALLVNTITAQSDSTQLAPIKDIAKEPLKLVDFLPYIGGLIGLGLLGLLFYYLSNRKKQQDEPTRLEIILPAHEIALNKLEQLKQAKLWQQGRIKDFQSELTFVIREYLENRFGIPALESTTDEIAKQFRTSELESEWKERLLSIFRTADLVKFAKAEPDIKVHDEGLKEAERFVIQTKKKPVPPEETIENDEMTDDEGKNQVQIINEEQADNPEIIDKKEE